MNAQITRKLNRYKKIWKAAGLTQKEMLQNEAQFLILSLTDEQMEAVYPKLLEIWGGDTDTYNALPN